jgi:hypothetical protein
MRDWGISRKQWQAQAGARDAQAEWDRGGKQFTGLDGRLSRSEKRAYVRAYFRQLRHAVRNS